MKKIKVIAIIITAIIIGSCYTVIASPRNAPGQLKEKNPNAPGQWKKTTEYATQEEFVSDIHMWMGRR